MSENLACETRTSKRKGSTFLLVAQCYTTLSFRLSLSGKLSDLNDSVNFRRVRRRVRAPIRKLGASLVQRRHSEKLDGITCIELRRRKRGPMWRVASRRNASIEVPRMPWLKRIHPARVFAGNVWLASLLSFISKSAIYRSREPRPPKPYQHFVPFLQTIAKKKKITLGSPLTSEKHSYIIIVSMHYYVAGIFNNFELLLRVFYVILYYIKCWK